ncbi:MAG TPA: archease [Thermoanaerobaculia bacterium]|nr:archease [Thermoanaerobaculia bacterium]
MPFRVLDHTADVGVEVAAASLAGLYEEAARGLVDAITELESVAPRQQRWLTAEAADRELLLVAWLEEVLYSFETTGFLAREVQVDLAGGDGSPLRLAATVRGDTFEPRRHPQKVQVKAITYHGLRVWEEGGEWRGRVIFDI